MGRRTVTRSPSCHSRRTVAQPRSSTGASTGWPLTETLDRAGQPTRHRSFTPKVAVVLRHAMISSVDSASGNRVHWRTMTGPPGRVQTTVEGTKRLT